MDSHSQEAQVEQELKKKELEQPWKFRKQENGMFKVYDLNGPKDDQGNPTKLLEGFEAEEWNSPLVGGRYIIGLIKAMEAKVAEKAESVKTASTATAGVSEVNAEAPGSKVPITHLPSGVALIGDPDDGRVSEPYQIGAVKYFEITVQEQADEVKRKDVLVTDGQGREFIVSYNQKAIVPSGVVNVLREAIYTFIKSNYDQARGMAWNEPYDVARFTIQIHREVPQAEAEAWLREQKKKYYSAAHV